MIKNLTYRKAVIGDLQAIIKLLYEDDLGQARENIKPEFHQDYIAAFNLINADSNQYLMVVESDEEIVATCHLTIMPSLDCPKNYVSSSH